MVYSSIINLIGNTPILRLKNIEKAFNLKANLYAKLECFNPAGSIKDRVAKNIIEDAEKKGLLSSNSVIIEPTSGNTGIGLCLVSLLKGYKTVIVMPENMSIERIKIMESLGAEVVLTDKNLGMQGAIDKANEIAKTTPNSFIAGQFENQANPEAHYNSTAPEIYNDLSGLVDAVVMGVGTGGTLTGVSKYLKERIKSVKVIGVEPFESAVLSGNKKGAHGIQGIGAGFIPKTLDVSLIDEVIKVKTDDAISTSKALIKLEGALCGISSGASLFAGIEIAKRDCFEGKNVVVILPDGAEKYLSTELFN